MPVSQSSQEGTQAKQLRLDFALVLVVLLAAHFLSPARQLELSWLELQFRLLRDHVPLPASQEVVVVGIDEATVRAPAVAAVGQSPSRPHPFFWAPFVVVGD